MVLQYKKKGLKGRWKDYPGKSKIKGAAKNYDLRLLNDSRTKILVRKAAYEKVMRRFRAIEFFKHKR